MILIDTSAWIEYFSGGIFSKKIETLLLGEDNITPTIVLAELSIRAEKESWKFESYLNFIKSKSIIIELNEQIITYIGKIYLAQRKIKSGFGICDAIIYSTALFEKAEVLTKDNDFEGLKNVILLK